MVAQSALERRWKWRGHDFHAFLNAGSREIYLERLIVLIKISIFGAIYRFSYRMEKDNDISPYRFIVPPLICMFIRSFPWYILNPSPQD